VFKRLLAQIMGSVTRFFVISAVLLAYLAARMLHADATYPLLLLAGLGVAAAGSVALVVVDAKGGDQSIGLALTYALLAGATAFALVFGVTWLLSSPPQ
jgi:hypothetical protein